MLAAQPLLPLPRRSRSESSSRFVASGSFRSFVESKIVADQAGLAVAELALARLPAKQVVAELTGLVQRVEVLCGQDAAGVVGELHVEPPRAARLRAAGTVVADEQAVGVRSRRRRLADHSRVRRRRAAAPREPADQKADDHARRRSGNLARDAKSVRPDEVARDGRAQRPIDLHGGGVVVRAFRLDRAEDLLSDLALVAQLV